MAKHVKRRIPKLQFTKLRGIGWHVSHRHPVTGMPRRERFGNLPRGAAEKAYYK
jgi:hypothetical protein